MNQVVYRGSITFRLPNWKLMYVQESIGLIYALVRIFWVINNFLLIFNCPFYRCVKNGCNDRGCNYRNGIKCLWSLERKPYFWHGTLNETLNMLVQINAHKITISIVEHHINVVPWSITLSSCAAWNGLGGKTSLICYIQPTILKIIQSVARWSKTKTQLLQKKMYRQFSERRCKTENKSLLMSRFFFALLGQRVYPEKPGSCHIF